MMRPRSKVMATSEPERAAPAVKAAPRRRSRAGASLRFADESAFVLHSWPYKETSLIIDALTRNHGRVALVARGAKRPHSALGYRPPAPVTYNPIPIPLEQSEIMQ